MMISLCSTHATLKTAVNQPDYNVYKRNQVEEKPDVTYSDVGGCKEQIEKLREVVEVPLLHVSGGGREIVCVDVGLFSWM